jgi:cysteinyl-tRNA synthetase
MASRLQLHNTLSGNKETFEPLSPPHVGMYVCGPTVYSNAHLGNARTYVSFDVLFRYLRHLGYKVRYVRNITDAGHLESDADVGEDKVSKKARLEQLEPMEIVQRYTYDFHKVMELMNNLPPSIEPTATGHVVEQIEMTRRILANGLAYESNGSVYFDVEKYAREHDYTVLSNRNLEELLNNTRELDGQDEKKGRLDFALWIKAKPEHIMRWPSPWGEGFPGWHLECSAMSSKYLGETFDIHGGGMDLIPTHHTNEIAQNRACNHEAPVKYWMHTNMLTVNGQKMSKSLGNAFLPHELFTGSHPMLDKGYSPMTVRFFMLQAHYRSTLDFSNAALQAAEKGLDRVLRSIRSMQAHMAKGRYGTADARDEVQAMADRSTDAMNDDLNTAQVIAQLFEASGWVNTAIATDRGLNQATWQAMASFFDTFMVQILGVDVTETTAPSGKDAELMTLLIELRAEAKGRKDFAMSDRIREGLVARGITIKDTKEGTVWETA